METFLFLFLALLCVMGFLFIVLIVLLLILLLLYLGLFARFKPRTDRQEFLAQTGAQLLPWSREAFTDLSTRWKADFKYGGRRGYFQGTVQSLGRPQAAWLAFHIDHHSWLNGTTSMHTSAQQIALQITWERGTSVPPLGQVVVAANGQPLGTIRLSDCTLFDREGNAVGTYPHRAGLHVSPVYYPLQVGGRTVAEVCDGWLIQPVSLSEPRPALRNVVPDLGPREEQWLLAALALELHLASRITMM